MICEIIHTSNSGDITTLENSVAALEASVQTISLNINESLSSRTYLDVANDSGNCDQRIDNFSFDTSAQTFDQSVEISDAVGGSICEDFTYSWDYATDLTTANLQVDTYNSGAADWAITFDEPWLLQKAVMRIGESWANYSERTLSSGGGLPTDQVPDYYKTTLVGVKDVSVTAGDFSDCLMFETIRTRAGVNDHRIYYYCDGPGLTRYINLTNQEDWQLENWTENL